MVMVAMMTECDAVIDDHLRMRITMGMMKMKTMTVVVVVVIIWWW